MVNHLALKRSIKARLMRAIKENLSEQSDKPTAISPDTKETLLDLMSAMDSVSFQAERLDKIIPNKETLFPQIKSMLSSMDNLDELLKRYDILASSEDSELLAKMEKEEGYKEIAVSWRYIPSRLSNFLKVIVDIYDALTITKGFKQTK